jgi:hypothetical protein
MKAQSVRLLDVFLIGPLMFWAGRKVTPEHPVAGPLLAFMGAGTVVYNGYNYLQVQSGNRLTGGYADRADASAVDPRELLMGTRVEMEHTNDPRIAREIALDHLVGEDPRYYTKLARAGL